MSPLLCLNVGSSSLKFSVFEGEQRRLRGAVEGLGSSSPTAWTQAPDAPRAPHPQPVADLAAALAFALHEAGPAVAVVAHRLVRGGPHDDAPQVIDDALRQRLRDATPLAPLHLPPALDALDACTRQRPDLPQLACFDTAFHATLPEVARRFPVPDALHARGLRRHGFHGLSCEHVVAHLGPALPARVIVAHLGSGASLTALHEGRSVDTTMGLTPTGGIPMSSRTGDLDPGLLLYLLQHDQMPPADLARLVEREGGLLAVGGSADMRTLLERRAHDPRAALAVDLFTRSVRKAIGALAACLGGLDLLVFTGGIGEHAAPVRAEVCHGMDFLDIRLDPARNARHDEQLSPDGARVAVRRIEAEEDRVMARHARQLIRAT